MKNLRTIIASVALSALMFAGGAAFTASANAQNIFAVTNAQLAQRGERGSARNIMVVRHNLERLIDQLQRDRHDYGGHREKAVDLMSQARNELLQAEAYDATHGH